MIISSCLQNNKQAAGAKTNRDSIPSPHITYIADLPDSNKPASFVPELVRPVLVKASSALPHYLVDRITNLPIPPEAQGRGLFTNYTTDEGISLDEIYCSLIDSAGNLWFGTNGGGISRYDGRNFINFTTANGLAYNLVWSIIQDKAGNLWIGTDGGGVSKYDGRSFTNYSTKEGLAHNVVNSITEDSKGTLWFGTSGGGISQYDGKSFTNYTTAQGLPSNSVSDIEEDGKGNLWIGTKGGGLSKFDGKIFSNYTTSNGLAHNNIRTVLADKTGNIWCGTLGGGVSRFDGKDFFSYSIKQGLADTMIWAISEDKYGNTWFGTNKGVSKFDGSAFTNYTTEQGLANNRVTSITEDDKGNIWLCTFGGGISKFAGKNISNYTTNQGLPNNVIYSIVEDSKGSLWLGTNGGGISRYDGKSFTNYSTAQGLIHNEVYSLLQDSKGNLWIGTYRHGVSKFDGKYFTHYTTAQGLANNTVFRIVEDNNGNLWFGTSGGGVSKFDGAGFTNYTTKQGLAHNVVFSILEDRKGNFWFGTLGGGVSKFDGKSFTNFTTAQGLADNAIWAINEDHAGDLWFGTQNGLNLLKRKNLEQFSELAKPGSPPLFETFTTKDGLPHDFISQIVPVSDNKIYIGTNFGMCDLHLSKTSDTNVVKWVVGNIFNTNTGYPIKDVNSGAGAMFIDRKGVIWLGTGSDKTGLVRFDAKNAVSSYTTPPTVVIKGIKINNENICWSDLGDSVNTAESKSEEINTFGRRLTDLERDSMRNRFNNISFTGISKWHPLPEQLVLPNEFNNITFDFNAIETGRNFLVKYQHMLEGYEANWSPPSHEATASFGNMFEGTYTFLLKAQSPEGIWSEPVSYTFEVRPPWWRTWWAYAVYVLMFIWALRSFSKFRERRLRLEKEKLELEVHHRTEMLENTIETLKTTQSQLVQSEKMASLGELTAGIAHEIQNPLNFVNNFSEVNKELLGDMHNEIENGNMTEIREIANDLLQNTEKITHHGKRADSIVKGMLMHARSSSGHNELTDINALADEYLKLAHHVIRSKEKDFNAEMLVEFDQSIGRINIIPQEIGRLLLNLYNNAFYAVADKAKKASNGFIPTVWVSTKKTGQKIEIKVKDNGMGIPENLKEKIFQPFFTTKPPGEGTGLGLSLSYDIVKTHQGSFHVNSKEGEFTEFIITLPAN